jgi:hypothetical protein
LFQNLKFWNKINIEEIIVCIYSHIDTDYSVIKKIMACIWIFLGGGVGWPVSKEADIRLGWIEDEKTDKNGVTVHLIAICPESAP